MAEHEEDGKAPPVEGLAGGPGPTPPGFDDGTPRPAEAAPSGGARPAPRGDPEEPDPS